MSKELEKYRVYIEKLGLNDEESTDLIGAIQCIVESLLNKKYMIGGFENENLQENHTH